MIMRTVRNACLATLIGLLPTSLLFSGNAWGQEEAASVPTAAAESKAGGKNNRDASARKSKAAARSSGSDRLNLDSTKVVGNRELPKVLYIVPWKRADIGELPGQPINSLLDEVLAPLDRDEYRREIRYYQAIAAPADQPAAASAPPVSQSQSAPTEK
jgi:hypothetical protein